MIISEWETEHWLFGKDKVTITLQPAMQQLIMLIKFKTSTIPKILREFGLTFTIHTVLIIIRQWHLSNMEMVKSKLQSMIQHIQPLNM